MPRGTPNASTKAKNNPVLLAPTLEAGEQPLGHTTRTKRTKDNPVGDVQLVQVADRMPDPEKAAMMSFMEEPVTIRIAQSTDQNAEQVFELMVNGRREFFRRGETKTVARKYVDLMARLKVTSYKNRETVNDQGEKTFVNDPFTALKYDFAVVADKNPLGDSWLKATLAMGG